MAITEYILVDERTGRWFFAIGFRAVAPSAHSSLWRHHVFPPCVVLVAVQLGLQLQIGQDASSLKEGIHEYKVGHPEGGLAPGTLPSTVLHSCEGDCVTRWTRGRSL